jgi:hypothetical protein
VDKRQTLSRVLADAQPQRVLVGMMDSAETRVRGELQQAAAKPAARAEAPEPTRGGHGRGRDHDRGPELILE